MKPLVLGTRGSDLALAQTRAVAARLRAAHPGLEVEERIIRTTGDVRLDISLSNPGPLDKGLFTKELELELSAGRIDAAVHSLKDLPTEQPPGLTLGAILEREAVDDLLISRVPGGLSALPGGAQVATSSLRRKLFLQWQRPDLTILDMRGNVPTRIRKLAEDPSLSAIVLAAAGIARLVAAGCPLALDGLHSTPLDFMLPAPGQGAVAVQCRADDLLTRSPLDSIHHQATALAVECERAILSGLGGGCSTPVGVRGRAENGALSLSACWFRNSAPVPTQAFATGSAEAAAEVVAQVLEQLRA